ncbi:DUF6950 family protein [Mesorhizobium sp. 128a]
MTEAERLAAVQAYVASESARPFVWGVTDCCSTVDRWVQKVRCISPLTLFDEWDRTAADAEECLSRPYSLPARINRALRKASVARTTNPQPGDIGLALFDGKVGVAIHAGAFWFSRGRDGLVGAPVSAFWKAWSV